ncbi:Orf25 [Heliothis zea nudivirus]|uniref:Orf25 n=1 Tax=Heliothis zea nudivirus 1 TaxID=3116536 RepID=Q8JKT6_9VIRU|nr:Orf25 [Heliothis zea nudivirus]AAN04320.1 Orf25 [Heliothis zea nudivirus]
MHYTTLYKSSQSLHNSLYTNSYIHLHKTCITQDIHYTRHSLHKIIHSLHKIIHSLHKTFITQNISVFGLCTLFFFDYYL